jgi:alpha-ketoglutarate-dependent taurine dioxygenase
MSAFDFAKFHTDLHRPDAVATTLREHGIATFEGIHSRAELSEAAARIMRPRQHRDAEPDSITDIRPNAHRQQQSSGIGFSRVEVAPHTEGSSLEQPPSLLLLVCVSPALSGGDTVLVDGLAVFHDLKHIEPDALSALSRPGAIAFGVDRYQAAAFSEVASGRVALRYRDDDLAAVANSDRWAWERLRAAVERRQMVFRLSAGQGLVLDNTRWLHGRTGFDGERLMYRLIGEPHFRLEFQAAHVSQLTSALPGKLSRGHHA